MGIDKSSILFFGGKMWLAIISLLFAISLPTFAESSSGSINVGGVIVPTPAGMSAVSNSSEFFRKILSASSNNTFALYYLNDDIPKLSSGARFTVSKNAYGKLSSVSKSIKEAEDLFIKDMVDLKLDLENKIVKEEEFNSLIKQGERDVEASDLGVKIDIDNVIYLNLDISRAWRGTFVLLANSHIDTDQGTFKVAIASANGWIRIGKTILFLVYNVNFENATSVAKAKQGLSDWMDLIQASNPKD